LSPVSRRHRRHSPEFKAGIVEACLQPGVSVSAVAVALQLNPNMVRKWITEHRSRDFGKNALSLPVEASNDRSAPSGFVPVTVPTTSAEPPGDIRIEIRRPQWVVQIDWPVSQSSAFAQWLRELLA
jgi:transposase-like protein